MPTCISDLLRDAFADKPQSAVMAKSERKPVSKCRPGSTSSWGFCLFRTHRLCPKEFAGRPNRTSRTGTAHLVSNAWLKRCFQVPRTKYFWRPEIRSHTTLGRPRFRPWYRLFIEWWQPCSCGLQPHPSGLLTAPLLCHHMLQSTAESGSASPTRQP